MIARSMTFVAQLTRMWVALYTAGLPQEPARARRDEIESDLWEQELSGVSNGGALARLVLGMPADLSWRLEQRAAKPPEKRRRKERSIMTSTTQGAFVGGALLMAAFTILVTAFVAFGGGADDIAGVSIPRPLWAVWGALAAAIILAGSWMSRGAPVRGGVLVLAGALPMAAILVWSVLLPAAWLLLAGLIIMRALQTGGTRDRIASGEERPG